MTEEKEYEIGDKVKVGGMEFTKISNDPFPMTPKENDEQMKDGIRTLLNGDLSFEQKVDLLLVGIRTAFDEGFRAGARLGINRTVREINEALDWRKY